MVLIFRSGLSSLNIYYSDVDHIIAAKYEALHIYMIVRPSPRDNSLFYDKKRAFFQLDPREGKKSREQNH